MENITYLIGAGASCKAMPLVSDMKERMEILFKVLNNKIGSSRSLLKRNYKYAETIKTLGLKYNLIFSELMLHKTPDTYAKKLWLNDSTDKLKTLKEFLNLYFIFEQNLNNDFLSYNSKLEISDIEALEKIKNLIDYRYDVFFATYLEKIYGKLKLPNNINIISWNYDNQFELAYNTYLESLSPKEITESLSIIDIHNLKSFDSNASNIIKLNGSCEYIGIDGNRITFENKIKELLDEEYMLNEKSLKINFAWENSEEQKELLSISKGIMEKTDKLVIIGYSFPIFNKIIDKLLFESYNNFRVKKIFIQVPKLNEFNKIKGRIQNLTELDIDFFTHIDDEDQFYIP